jgi:glycosyltransferase involved in cell wall biosynthesis
MMAPKRLLMTTDAVGGVWTFSLELARGLAGLGVETVLAVLGPPPSEDQRRAADAVPALRLVTMNLDLEWRDRAGSLSPAAAARLRRIERLARPDIVHVNGFREAAAGFAAPVVLGAHSCVRTWWKACRGGEPDAEWARYERGVREGLAHADVVVAPTYSFLMELENAWGDLPSSRLVFNGLDIDRAPPVPRRRMILAAGRFEDEAKNIACLKAVAAALPWPVHLAGETASDGHGSGVHHLGRLPREGLLRSMAGAEIFVSPTYYEPFGLAVLEAAKSGCALVLSDVSSLVELWDDAALFVPPDDSRALEAALLRLIGDDALRRRLQSCAMLHARAYTRTRMAHEYLALYRRLCRDARAPVVHAGVAA